VRSIFSEQRIRSTPENGIVRCGGSAVQISALLSVPGIEAVRRFHDQIRLYTSSRKCEDAQESRTKAPAPSGAHTISSVPHFNPPFLSVFIEIFFNPFLPYHPITSVSCQPASFSSLFL